MYQLVIDTSQDKMYFAILQNKQTLVASQVIFALRQQSDLMVSSLDQFLSANTFNVHDFDAVICCIGPGSFVGVRVGLTFAKIMAVQYKIPLYTYTSLESMQIDDNCIVTIDAKGKKFFVQVYTDNELVLENAIMTYEELEQLKQTLVLHQLVSSETLLDSQYFKNIIQLLDNKQPVIALDLIEPMYLK